MWWSDGIETKIYFNEFPSVTAIIIAVMLYARKIKARDVTCYPNNSIGQTSKVVWCWKLKRWCSILSVAAVILIALPTHNDDYNFSKALHNSCMIDTFGVTLATGNWDIFANMHHIYCQTDRYCRIILALAWCKL